MKKSIAVDASEYAKNRMTQNFMTPAENFVRIIKTLGIDMNASTDKHALDFGCGDGRHCSFLVQNGFNVVGTDISEEAIQLASDRLSKDRIAESVQLQLIVNCAELLNLQKKFDLIVAWEVIHWLGTHVEWDNCIRIFKSLLKTKGIIIFTMPAEDHYVLREATQISDHEYLCGGSLRKDCEMFAPPLSWIEEYITSIGLRSEFIGCYQHGNSLSEHSLENRFSKYCFAVSQNVDY